MPAVAGDACSGRAQRRLGSGLIRRDILAAPAAPQSRPAQVIAARADASGAARQLGVVPARNLGERLRDAPLARLLALGIVDPARVLLAVGV